MSSAARYRPSSPGSSYTIDPMRASTGTVQLSSSYDPYDSSAGRQMYSGYRSDVPSMPSYDPRYAVAPRLEAHPVSKQTYRDEGKPPKLRTEYAIRPRQRSSTTSVTDSHGRLDIPTSSPVSRHSPVVLSDHGRSPSPLTDHDGYLMPASSKHHHHRRHRHSSSFDYSSDTGRAPTSRAPHGSYPMYEHRRRYPQAGGLRKGEDIDDYDAYSYTSPREQFEKEAAAKLRYHRSARKERPLSLTGIEDSHLAGRKDSRASGPPPARRGFEKMNRDGMRRSTYGYGNSELDLAGGRHRSSPRAVTLHQDPDEGYSSYRDDIDDTRLVHREHQRPDKDGRDREPQDSRTQRQSSNKLSAPPTPSNGLGTAVLASGYSDDLDYDLTTRSGRHRSRDLTVGDHSRSRRRSRRRAESDSDGYTSDDDLKKYRREPSVRPRIPGSDSSKENEHPHRHRSRSRHHDPSAKQRRPDTQKKGEPSPPKENEAPPKGILKPPRAKFPEEPNPVREGVAPLKDAHKKGIPPGARWTKIDRRLVNPAALQAGQERFEERPEYVIVLRVLSKEEIQAYAVKTQEIRDARYRDYVSQRRRRREESRRRGYAIDDFSSDDEDEDDDSPLAIEGPGGSKTAQKNPGAKNEPIRLA
ncbi:hypothetical protein BJY01DRAFT_145916 [Aspergillus pseudoustus]|uniref:DUF8035 domain-containing protein n=1 Tax=Aspergillus pseudoustus TaxID=1810923 RepID=A0ABR4KD83_9EURO